MLTRALALLFLLFCTPALAFDHGAVQSQGGGVNLLQSNVFAQPYGAALSTRTLLRPAASTADYYHIDGLYFFQPYDLNAMGSWGQAIATAKGNRYVWMIGADHPDDTGGSGSPDENGWGRDAQGIYVGFSNDPTILPDPSTMTQVIPAYQVTISAQVYSEIMVPWFVYDPDDSTNHAKIFTQCFTLGGSVPNSWEECAWVRNDFNGAFTANGPSHSVSVGGGFAAFQTVYRLGVGSWVSYGGGTPNDSSGLGTAGYWTASSAVGPYTFQANYTTSNGAVKYPNLCIGSPYVVISGQRYSVTVEDSRSAAGGMYVAKVPVDSNCNINVSGTPPITRLSTSYAGVYPGPTYLQEVSGYYEDGVYYSYASHGFFADNGLTEGALYAAGGGLDEQYRDIYAVVLDATAAANAAPPGVRASVAAGTLTLSWYDILPNHTYRVYDCGTDSTCATSPTVLGNPTTGQFQTTPAASSSCTLHYYKVVTLSGSTEEGSRTLGTFVSSAAAFVNQHMTRVCKAGAVYSTIDQTWLASVDNWIENTCKCLSNLLVWADPAFGVTESGAVITKMFDLGTTFLPRGGDYTPTTSSTTYSANGFGSSGVPEWINGTGTAYGYFGSGRLNQLRRLWQGFSMVASYISAGNATLLGFGENCCVSLKTTSTQATFSVGGFSPPPAWTSSDTAALAAKTTQIIGGTFDTKATVYVEGVAGSGGTPATDASAQIGQTGASANIPFLESGATQSKFVSNSGAVGGSYSFDDNNAAYSGSDLIVFQGNLAAMTCGGSNCMVSMTNLIRARVGN